MDKVTKTLMINGLKVDASYYEDNVEHLFVPLLNQLDQLVRQTQKRVIVILVAPPGTGKSTLVEFLQELAKQRGLSKVQGIGMDGFHYSNAYLRSHTIGNDPNKPLLMTVKGAPESFDATRLIDKIKQLKYENVVWPFYSRIQHDVCSDGIVIDAPIVIIEGNYLLLDRYPWNTIKDLADRSIILKADRTMIKNNLIQRKIDGGSTMDEAIKHYRSVDRPDIDLVLDHSLKADLQWFVDEYGHFSG